MVWDERREEQKHIFASQIFFAPTIKVCNEKFEKKNSFLKEILGYSTAITMHNFFMDSSPTVKTTKSK